MLNTYQLERQIEAQMEQAHVPGVALAIVHGQEIAYARGFGVTSIEAGGNPVTPDTVFRIGSTSKALTGTAAMRLVETGKLDLDVSVKNYLPWFRLHDPDTADRVTLRKLLNHTAGLPTAYEPFGSRAPEALGSFIRQEVPKFVLVAPPGKVCSYSNLHTNIVGHIIEVVTGQFFEDAMQELIFQPLEMYRSTFDVSVAMTYPLALGHELSPDGFLCVQHRFVENVVHNPAGFGLSTVLDMANFAMMHMNGGRFRDQQLLSAALVAAMQTIEGDLYSMSKSGYGLPFLIHSYRGIQRVSHNGDVPSFGSLFYMAPDEGLAVIMLVNRIDDFWPAAIKIVNQIYTQLLDLPSVREEPQVIEPDRALWSMYVGIYESPIALPGLEVAARVEVKVVGDELTLDAGGVNLPLQAMRDDFYFALPPDSKRATPVGFIPEAEGPVQFLMLNSQPYRRVSG